MLRKLAAVFIAALISITALVGGGAPAQAAGDATLKFRQDPGCAPDAPGLCTVYEFVLRGADVRINEDKSEYPTVDTYLYDARGRRLDNKVDGNIATERTITDYVALPGDTPLPAGKYTLRVKVHSYGYFADEECGWGWNSSGTLWNWHCNYDNFTGTYARWYSFEFNFDGKNWASATQKHYKASATKTATTYTTYTAKKKATYTAKATYSTTQKAAYRYKGKTYTASATIKVTKTSPVAKTATYKGTKIKRTAKKSVTAWSDLSPADATSKANTGATAGAKATATKSAKAYVEAKALAKAKALITKVEKKKATAKAEAKLTKSVKAAAVKKAKAAALAAAKKKVRG